MAIFNSYVAGYVSLPEGIEWTENIGLTISWKKMVELVAAGRFCSCHRSLSWWTKWSLTPGQTRLVSKEVPWLRVGLKNQELSRFSPRKNWHFMACMGYLLVIKWINVMNGRSWKFMTIYPLIKYGLLSIHHLQFDHLASFQLPCFIPEG